MSEEAKFDGQTLSMPGGVDETETIRAIQCDKDGAVVTIHKAQLDRLEEKLDRLLAKSRPLSDMTKEEFTQMVQVSA